MTEPAEAAPRGHTCRPAHERLFLGLETQRAPALCEIRTCRATDGGYDLPDGWDGGGALLGVLSARVCLS